MSQHLNPLLGDEERVGARRSAITLDALPRGVSGRVVSVEGSGPVARRLMEMGIVPGARIQLVREAPFGDPVEVRVMSYHLALRRSEARTITVISDE